MRQLLAALLLLASFPVLAEENLDYSIHQDYITPRSLSSGGTFTVIDDYNTLFYNPAGMARLEDGELNLGFMAGITSEAMTFSNDITAASKASSETEKIQKVQELLDKNYGKNFATRLPALSALWVRPKWGVGLVLADSTINLAIHQTSGPQLAVSAYVDNTLAFGMSKAYGEEKALTVGGTVKVVYRGYVGRSFSAFDIATDPKFFKPADAKEGMTVDADLGTQYVVTVPEEGWLKWMKYAKPTFGLVVRNIADYGFMQNSHLIDKNSGNEPPHLGRRFDVGSKWELPSFWVFHPKFMLDERDIGHRHFTVLKGFHTGFELEWKAFGWLKGYYAAGLGQGYLSAGVGAQLAWFRLDASTYGEEMGTSTQKLENRFYIAKMSLDF